MLRQLEHRYSIDAGPHLMAKEFRSYYSCAFATILDYVIVDPSLLPMLILIYIYTLSSGNSYSPLLIWAHTKPLCTTCKLHRQRFTLFLLTYLSRVVSEGPTPILVYFA